MAALSPGNFSERRTINKLDIYNRALGMIGSTRLQLVDTSTDNVFLNQLDLHHDFALSELGRMHNWNDFYKRLEVAVEVYEPLQNSSKLASYPIPDSAEFIDRATFTGLNLPPSVQQVEFFPYLITTGSNATTATGANRGLIVKTFGTTPGADPDQNQLDLTYREVNTSYSLWQPYLVEIFVTMLASKIAVPISGSVERQFELYKEIYEILLPEAKRLDALTESNKLVDENNNTLTEEPFTFIKYEKV